MLSLICLGAVGSLKSMETKVESPGKNDEEVVARFLADDEAIRTLIEGLRDKIKEELEEGIEAKIEQIVDAKNKKLWENLKKVECDFKEERINIERLEFQFEVSQECVETLEEELVNARVRIDQLERNRDELLDESEKMVSNLEERDTNIKILKMDKLNLTAAKTVLQTQNKALEANQKTWGSTVVNGLCGAGAVAGTYYLYKKYNADETDEKSSNESIKSGAQ